MKLLMETYNLARTYGIKEALRMLHDAGFDAADVSLYRLAPTGVHTPALSASMPTVLGYLCFRRTLHLT